MMNKIEVSALCAGGLFAGVLICLKLGWRLGRSRLAREGEDGHSGLGAIEGAVFGLLGLLIAFTFNGAATRFDERRQLIVTEVNALSTAWQRLDLLEAGPRQKLRDLFRRYLDSRLELYRNHADTKVIETSLARVAALQGEIWANAVAAARTDHSQPLAQVLLPPINAMFDAAESRWLATRMHPPLAIYSMLGTLVLAGALLAGFGMAKAKQQSWMHLLGFAAIMAVAIYLILDLEFPRQGLIRVDGFDRAFIELRDTMK